MKKIFIAPFLILILSVTVKAQSLEYRIKASFIEKISRYTDWDSNDLGDNFVISILGESPFNGELESLAGKLKIKDRPIKINYHSKYKDVKDCHVLFICSSEEDNLKEIIKKVGNYKTMLIADTPGYCKMGVHFNFYLEENATIRFEINVKALQRSKLKPDMQLLHLGKIID